MRCSREGCEHRATVAPIVCVPAVRAGSRPALRLKLSLTVCAECWPSLKAADFVARGDPGRDHLRWLLMMRTHGLWLLDFEAAWLEPGALS